MAIQFDKLSTSGGHASTLDFTKAVEVTSGERVKLDEVHPGVSKLRVEMYWESDNDGDVSAVLLDSNKKAVAEGLVFYGNLSTTGVVHSGDVRGDTDGDPSTPEETITADLGALDASVDSIVMIASTYPAAGSDKPVPFGKLTDCRVLVINDENNEVLFGYEVDEDFSTYTSVELCSFYRKDGGFRMVNMGAGVGKSLKALEDIAAKYEVK